MSQFNEKLFVALKPPLVSVELNRFDGCTKGDKVHLTLKFPLGPSQKWNALVTENGEDDEKIYFIDKGEILPFPIKEWTHEHLIFKKSVNACIITDKITYFTGNKILDVCIFPFLYFVFYWRKPIYRKLLNQY